MAFFARPACVIRWMTSQEIDGVLRIEQEAFGDQAWTLENFLQCVASRSHFALVAYRGGTLVGHCIYELSPGKTTIHSIAVDERHRLCGVGSEFIARLRMQSSRTIEAITSERNLTAQVFFRACGLRCTSIDHDDDGDAGYVFQLAASEQMELA